MNEATVKTSVNTGSQKQQHQYIALMALLAAGLLLGITTNLAKVAHSSGIAPLSYLIWSLLGATLILVVLSTLRGQAVKLNRRTIEYFIIAGFLTTAGANLIFFNAVPRLGVSFVALMIALPPLLTYVGALALGMERFCWWRMTGVLLALLGAALLVAKHWATPDADIFWIALTLVGPVLLAAGNIYRTLRWPPGASAEALAPGMLMAGTGLLLVFALAAGDSLTLPAYSSGNISLFVFQSVVFAGQFLLMFVLQKSGGPVFLSLMGGVSAVFGVPIAMVFLGETAIPGFLISAVLVTAGIISQLMGWETCKRKKSFQSVGG